MADKTICGAKSKSTGKPCQRAPMENGRCHVHGGKSTGPRDKSKLYGNKNARKTGEYETIWLDTLDAEEQELFEQIDLDVLKQLDDEIRLITIRERRMLQRIESLKNTQYIVTDITATEGLSAEGPINTRTERQENTLLQIQAIEEALTRVQDKKAKLLELKYKIQQTDDDETDGDGLESLSAAIRASHELLGE